MSDISKFFHDRIVLFLLTVNAFLTVVTALSILLRLGSTDDQYYQSYRPILGKSKEFTTGGISEPVSFIIFAGIILAISWWLALRLHAVRKQASWLLLGLTTLILVLALIVGNSLLSV